MHSSSMRSGGLLWRTARLKNNYTMAMPDGGPITPRLGRMHQAEAQQWAREAIQHLTKSIANA
ncbi:MAG: hypothetical protein CL583_12375 [Alteromonadaceae bacterium]|uniref:Uncharacterized protein n=1 Tax=Hydrocarboniclastica marina TaxID=2259620 RepID=A0A4P7XGX6_9ALTE|nr:hypothetical protein [Alteromonadaceae bacterium]QCF25975.1 hypothetical protein soil367_08595 [Hydrocarboniclastica marina]